MRPRVEGGLCSAVRVAAWGSILLSLYLRQIFVSLLQEITNVKCSEPSVGRQDYDTMKLFYWVVRTVQ